MSDKVTTQAPEPKAEGRYRKRPIEIDAWQFNGWNDSWPAGVPDWISEREKVYGRSNPGDVRRELHPIDGTPILTFVSLEGSMIAGVGAWIIRGVKGELYTCQDDIFNETYEPTSAPTLKRERDELLEALDYTTNVIERALEELAYVRKSNPNVDLGARTGLELKVKSNRALISRCDARDAAEKEQG